jgi:predicted DNA-binding transcriptional regulator YafY
MRKSERLFQLISVLRGRRRAVTAAALASELGVARRTVYRDVRSLIDSGVPIVGEAGVGYLLDRSFDLPPLRFSVAELTAILVGNRMVEAWTDEALAAAAKSVEAKVLSSISASERRRIAKLPYRVPIIPAADRKLHAEVRTACERHLELRVRYADPMTRRDREHVLWPLCLVSWGDHWTLLAWSATDDGYRNFRLDRLLMTEVTGESFSPDPHRSLEHYLRDVVGVGDDQMPSI